MCQVNHHHEKTNDDCIEGKYIAKAFDALL
jgi:hypothetical protein